MSSARATRWTGGRRMTTRSCRPTTSPSFRRAMRRSRRCMTASTTVATSPSRRGARRTKSSRRNSRASRSTTCSLASDRTPCWPQSCSARRRACAPASGWSWRATVPSSGTGTPRTAPPPWRGPRATGGPPPSSLTPSRFLAPWTRRPLPPGSTSSRSSSTTRAVAPRRGWTETTSACAGCPAPTRSPRSTTGSPESTTPPRWARPPRTAPAWRTCPAPAPKRPAPRETGRAQFPWRSSARGAR